MESGGDDDKRRDRKDRREDTESQSRGEAWRFDGGRQSRPIARLESDRNANWKQLGAFAFLSDSAGRVASRRPSNRVRNSAISAFSALNVVTAGFLSGFVTLWPSSSHYNCRSCARTSSPPPSTK